MRVTERNLLIENPDGAVGRAVKRKRNGRIVNARLLTVADAQEPGAVRRLLVVKSEIALIGVIGERYFLGVIVGSHAGCGYAGGGQLALE